MMSSRLVFCASFAIVVGACELRGGLSSEEAAERARIYMREHEDTLVEYLDSATVRREGDYWLVWFLRRDQQGFPAFRSIRVHHTTGTVVPELDR
jgi:hypothetical protein